MFTSLLPDGYTGLLMLFIAKAPWVRAPGECRSAQPDRHAKEGLPAPAWRNGRVTWALAVELPRTGKGCAAPRSGAGCARGSARSGPVRGDSDAPDG